MNKSNMLKMTVTAVVLLFLGSGTFMFAGQDFGNEKPIEYAGDVLDGGAKMGLVVPKYTYDKGITGIGDLNEHSSKFKGTITGIDAGAGITEATRNAIEDYNLGLTLQLSSEAGMLIALRTAIENGDDIVVTLWDPHWIGSIFELEYLDDPEASYGDAESIEVWTRAGLLDDDPELVKLLSRYNYSVEKAEFNELLDYTEGSNVEAATKLWIDDNREIVDVWLDGIDRDALRGGVIYIGLVSWACAMASSNVLMHVLIELGYDARLMYVDAGVMFTGLAYGVTDIVTTVWSPGTHEYYLDRYAGPDWLEDYNVRKGLSP